MTVTATSDSAGTGSGSHVVFLPAPAIDAFAPTSLAVYAKMLADADPSGVVPYTLTELAEVCGYSRSDKLAPHLLPLIDAGVVDRHRIWIPGQRGPQRIQLRVRTSPAGGWSEIVRQRRAAA